MSEKREAAKIGFTEFVVLAAAMMSTQAIAIDAMLPAFPVIVQALQVADVNHGQWIITAYVIGLGVGQLFWGVMSDRFGRRPMLLGGLGLYVLAAMLCAFAGSFHALLAWRLVHGLAAASVTVTRSVVRDLYSGRNMARVMSLTFVVFLIVPIIAPSIGQLIMLAAPWRYIFVFAGGFTLLVWLWALLRLPETLHPEYRMILNPTHILGAARLVLGNRISICYTLCMTVMFGALIGYVGMVPQIFAEVFHKQSLMPLVFALCAAFMGVASFLNSRMVGRMGMRRISQTALLTYILISIAHVAVAALGYEDLWVFVLLQGATMACFSLCVSNFGAMAMEPLGAVAGIGASLQGFVSTFGGALVAAAIGRQFNGTIVPLAAGALGCGLASLLFVLIAEQGRLFRGHHSGGGGQSPGPESPVAAASDGAANVEGAGLH